jgi:hypothetical protein
MLTIPRSVLQSFLTVCRRAGIRKVRRSAGPVITMLSNTGGYRLQVLTRDLAIEYAASISGPDIAVRLPLDALDTCAGRRDEPVTFDVEVDSRIELRWTDRGVPRRSECSQPPAVEESFPTPPTSFVTNDAELWKALGDAVTCTDEESKRYALGCLQLCGGSGRIEATDGRQALVQSGFSFTWEENLLVPGNKLLGCADIKPSDTIEIGRTEDWVALRIRPWLIQLRIQKEARFPKIEQVIPNPELARSRLELSPGDAEFLKSRLSHLPCHDEAHRPITLDLNGRVLVRSRELSCAYPVEVDLRSSQFEGDPLILNTDRRYVDRALELGFRKVLFHGPSTPALAVDDRRQYLWAVLDKGSAIPRHENPQKVESPLAVAKLARPRRDAPVRIAA